MRIYMKDCAVERKSHGTDQLRLLPKRSQYWLLTVKIEIQIMVVFWSDKVSLAEKYTYTVEVNIIYTMDFSASQCTGVMSEKYSYVGFLCYLCSAMHKSLVDWPSDRCLHFLICLLREGFYPIWRAPLCSACASQDCVKFKHTFTKVACASQDCVKSKHNFHKGCIRLWIDNITTQKASTQFDARLCAVHVLHKIV